MNSQNLIKLIKQFSPQQFESICIVNGAILDLSEVEDMGCKDFWIKSKFLMPLKLYKYFPDVANQISDRESVNYSIQALERNTVFMQTPSEFDDIYDSDIHIELSDYERLRLIEYCHRCGIETNENISAKAAGDLLLKRLYDEGYSVDRFRKAFENAYGSELIKLSNELFCLRLYQKLQETGDLGKALAELIKIEYDLYCYDLKNRFRVSCFATTPYSQLMWGGSYANCHRGFCLEYTVLPNEERYIDLYHNLFPMIYCKTRPNMSEKIVKAKDKEPTLDNLWDIYFHGVLRKSIDWAYQNEWRLLLLMKRTSNINDYNIEFFPITKVYLGNRMSLERKHKVIEICKRRNIPYVGMIRDPNIFEMRECEV